MTQARLKVYWRPGCSSCVRVKEFLQELGVDYESVNVSARPEAMLDLARMGVRTIPVVTRGADYVFAQELADVSRFVGVAAEFTRLPAAVLVEKWLKILEAAQRHVMQLPAERLCERATPGRNRSIRDLAYHVYQVADAFLQAVEHGVEDLASVYNAPPPSEVKSSRDIEQYGVAVTVRVRRWWAQLRDKTCAGELNTYYGAQSLHHVLERTVWHCAQHARQIIAVLERYEIPVEGPLTHDDYAGLPLPAGLWE